MGFRIVFTILAFLWSATAAAQCRLCGPRDVPDTERSSLPLSIDIETALDVGRAAGTGSGGSITIDERSGARRLQGLSDLGGFAMKGSVRISGEPFRRVRIFLPPNVRLMAPDGSSAQAVNLRTDLPPDPALDATGTLVFSFGGQLVVGENAAGEFRGRIPITVDYQ